MRIDNVHWVRIVTRASQRANNKYPKQPERARQMADHECGISNGPYQFEPLTIFQRIQVLIYSRAHERDGVKLKLAGSQKEMRHLRVNRFFNLLFNGAY